MFQHEKYWNIICFWLKMFRLYEHVGCRTPTTTTCYYSEGRVVYRRRSSTVSLFTNIKTTLGRTTWSKTLFNVLMGQYYCCKTTEAAAAAVKLQILQQRACAGGHKDASDSIKHLWRAVVQTQRVNIQLLNQAVGQEDTIPAAWRHGTDG